MSKPDLTISAVESNHMDEEAEIAALAYRFYEEEGRPDGKEQEHWLRAEQMVRGPVGTTGPNTSQVRQIFDDHAVEL